MIWNRRLSVLLLALISIGKSSESVPLLSNEIPFGDGYLKSYGSEILGVDQQHQIEEALAGSTEARIAFISPVDGRKCVLEHECSICVTQPSVEEVESLESGCDPETKLKNCRKDTRTEPLEKRVKICSEKTSKQCESPCFNCPTFCRPQSQFWCEDDYKVSQLNEQILENGKVIHRVTEHLQLQMNCYERDLEPLCAPVNCRFQSQGSDCVETIKTVNVTLVDQS
ncbi:uncharacterized protein LOC131877317 isoform X2 [Tigriopus californicus]|uniref:uncharacterized protein LOC131877317 isoform X2 n=1 Tax=Tigriopus californicus TaxID=6832 RepID=UPI0027DA7788|nr:uncharacterized protein LOC131877317 isoform X2 [Tigriopus californicus]